MSQNPACGAWRTPAQSDARPPAGDAAPADPALARLVQLFRRHAPDTAERMLQDAIRQYRGVHDQ